ncbi:protein SOB FIVE-LIKE 5-like [Mercurialis annua]|uniref:protein SOB FIVE-LIKE 5-like n=1 Tax=Mercurialis annua TaxID=3986 RepID=UPI00215F5170|nr:protein SOB FIVE-LIKE 5-like [Mercurialis annua]
MNMSASHCSSSGCESGWTSYLDQSVLSKNQYQGFDGNSNYSKVNDDDGGGEEDLSMVSDASSGPPHYCEDGEQWCFDQFASNKKNKNKKKSGRSQLQFSFLDDTASSPVLNKKIGDKDNEASQGFSATHYKEKSSLKKHFGFFKSEKSASKEPGGRKWK